MPVVTASEYSPEPEMLKVDDVTLQYKTPRHLVTATYKVSFSVRERDRYVILGPSGCGKSTLLKAVGGFMAPVAGAISVRGQPVSAPGPDRMMVFQEFEQLMPWKTVLQNVDVSDEGDRKIQPCRGARARYRHDRESEARQVPRRLSAYAFGRNEDARRAGARDGARSLHPADGRALCRTRCADAARDAGRASELVGSIPLHRPVRHPLDRGSDPGRLTHPGAFAASRPRPRRTRCQPFPVRQHRQRRVRSALAKRIHGLLFGKGPAAQELI